MKSNKIGDGDVLKLIAENEIKTCIVIDSITVCDTNEEVIIDHICYDGSSIFILQEELQRIEDEYDNLFLVVRSISEDAHICDYDGTLFETDEDEMIEIELS